MTPQEGIILAESYLQARYGSKAKDLKIMEDKTIEVDFGWIFFYQSKSFLETNNSKFMLVGNAPLIVDKINRSVHPTGTCLPLQSYIDRYANDIRKWPI